jgi:hypothetical protein
MPGKQMKQNEKNVKKHNKTAIFALPRRQPRKCYATSGVTGLRA